MTVDLEALRAIVTPLLAPLALELYDIELTGSGRSRVVRVSVFRPASRSADQADDADEGPDKGAGQGLDLAALSAATHAVEHAIEEAIDGAFQLEVSSPGLERKLARSEHFRSAIGSEISVKYRDAAGAATRVRGHLTNVADATTGEPATGELATGAGGSITIADEHGEQLVIARDDIASARTVFEWGPAPRPGRRPKDTSPTGAHARVKETTRS